jgi:hypothetical protein
MLDWEPAEMNGRKPCEIVYAVVRGRVDGVVPSRPAYMARAI